MPVSRETGRRSPVFDRETGEFGPPGHNSLAPFPHSAIPVFVRHGRRPERVKTGPGEPFGPLPLLMAQAEAVDKLQAICVICGSPASRTQRLIDNRPANYDDPVILVGASEVYEARCRRCHDVPPPKSQEVE